MTTELLEKKALSWSLLTASEVESVMKGGVAACGRHGPGEGAERAAF